MNALKKLYFALIYVFFYIPIMVLIIFSFNKAKYSGLWHGFSWQWYQQLAQDGNLILAAKHSFLLGFCAATLATLIGLIAAVALFRFHFKLRKGLHVLLFVMIILPDIILGLSLLLFYSLLHIPLGFISLLIAHITFCLPFSIFIIYGRLNSTDHNIINAAKDLGASDWCILFKIIIPMALSAIVVAWLLSFTLSIDDIVISYFVSGPTFQILPLAIYSSIRAGITPELNALCTLLFTITSLTVLLVYGVLRRRSLMEALL